MRVCHFLLSDQFTNIFLREIKTILKNSFQVTLCLSPFVSVHHNKNLILLKWFRELQTPSSYQCPAEINLFIRKGFWNFLQYQHHIWGNLLKRKTFIECSRPHVMGVHIPQGRYHLKNKEAPSSQPNNQKKDTSTPKTTSSPLTSFSNRWNFDFSWQFIQQ